MLISFSCKNIFEVIFDTQWMIIESLKTTITKMGIGGGKTHITPPPLLNTKAYL